MVWDLRAALLKKGEVESARLDAFEFRLRARTMRMMAERLGLDGDDLARAIAEKSDEAILADLAGTRDPQLVESAYAKARADARTALIAEFGDPTPYKLA